jgi:hypothetical protein
VSFFFLRIARVSCVGVLGSLCLHLEPVWLQWGDRNTGFFHKSATSRRVKNRIRRLSDSNGNIYEGKEQLNPMISEYFAGLFATEVAEPDPAPIG